MMRRRRVAILGKYLGSAEVLSPVEFAAYMYIFTQGDEEGSFLVGKTDRLPSSIGPAQIKDWLSQLQREIGVYLANIDGEKKEVEGA